MPAPIVSFYAKFLPLVSEGSSTKKCDVACVIVLVILIIIHINYEIIVILYQYRCYMGKLGGGPLFLDSIFSIVGDTNPVIFSGK